MHCASCPSRTKLIAYSNRATTLSLPLLKISTNSGTGRKIINRSDRAYISSGGTHRDEDKGNRGMPSRPKGVGGGAVSIPTNSTPYQCDAWLLLAAAI